MVSIFELVEEEEKKHTNCPGMPDQQLYPGQVLQIIAAYVRTFDNLYSRVPYRYS